MSNTFFNHTNRFVKLDTVRAEDVNAVFDEVATGLDGVQAKTDAALKLPSGEAPTALPAPGARANKVLTFDAGGTPVAQHSITDVATVSANINSINTVSGINSQVVAVAANAVNINAVAANEVNINAAIVSATSAHDSMVAAAGSATAAAGSATAAAGSAQQCANLQAQMASGPVVSVNGHGGVVTLTLPDLGIQIEDTIPHLPLFSLGVI